MMDDIQTKMKALEELKRVLSGMENDQLGGLKKVSVMSPTSEGLKEGLTEAEDVVEGDVCPVCKRPMEEPTEEEENTGSEEQDTEQEEM